MELLRFENDASSTSFNRDWRKLGAVGLLSALSRAALDASPFCTANAASSSALLVLGRFSFRSGSVGSGDGERVGDLRFRAALGSLSSSRARSNAFHALISSRDSGWGVGALGTLGREGRGA